MDITNIIKLVFAILSAVLTYFVIPYIRAKTNDSELESLKSYIRAAVHAAEMLYKESGMGKNKKEYVVEYLKELGYSVDINEIDALIEGAVFDLKNSIE